LSPDLGQPLAMDRPRAGRLLPRPLVAAILTALFDAGVEAPGFVPRNLFCDDRVLHVIDWEDARLATTPVLPDAVTLAKWDIGWSDIYAPRGGCPRYAWRPTTQLEPNTPINVPLPCSSVSSPTLRPERDGTPHASERRGSAACPRV
jgi:hypothetical protein